ncbi:PTS sugar transporter subunit IIA [Lacrimispora aerotolerans]|uniref:PTS sugar transporter subunit IIA n=1 Tax=Lacrimispora aerotolerans TaxID=36832 RepID=UPI00068CB384|nr:PTS glucose transporter subunit IIA [Lacrimispora aerotolerans]
MGFLNNLFGNKEKNISEAPAAKSIICEPNTIYSPLKGTVIPLAEVSDPVFAEEVMGPGVGIEPEEGKLYAPVDGEIISVFPTGHAIGMKTADGMEVLLHIGIDTVQLEGDGFQAFVKQGDHVKAGELLVEFDCAKIKEKGYQTTTMVLVPNAALLGTMSQPHIGKVEVLEQIFNFQ